jgi:hypothetical protein
MKAGKTTPKKSKAAEPSNAHSAAQLVNNRPQAAAQRKMQELADNSAKAQQMTQLQTIADHEQQPPLQRKANSTGMPDQLKSGVENLSGHAMDDVKVHYNSNKPAKLQAHAYAQGADIHLAPGQEKHLPHEAWHVAQQKQGRVKPTLQMKQGTPVNDDAGLEKEADIMGAKSLASGGPTTAPLQKKGLPKKGKKPAQAKFTAAGSKGIDVDQSAHAGTEGVAQLLITYDGKNKIYGKNGTRSGWQVHADKSILNEYNERTGGSHAKIDYDNDKLTRNHVGSFDGLQRYIVDYLNSPSGEGAFVSFLTSFTATLDHSDNEYVKIMKSWNTLKSTFNKGAGDSDDVVNDANHLLSLLNNLSENLRAADKHLNSYVHERPDLVFNKKADDTFSLNQHSRNILGMGADYWSEIPTTPLGGLVTSQGRVSRGDLSPTSRQLITTYPKKVVKPKSAKVKEKLHGKTPYSSFRTAPKPKINLTSTSQTQTTSVPQIQPPPQPQYRYASIGKEYTYPDGTTVWKANDNQIHGITFLHIGHNGTTVIKDLGPQWTPPPRFVSPQLEFTNPDKTQVWKYQDTQNNNHWNYFLYASDGTTFLKDLGTHWTKPQRYTQGAFFCSYPDKSYVWKYFDAYIGLNTFLYYAPNGTCLKDLGPQWKP